MAAILAASDKANVITAVSLMKSGFMQPFECISSLVKTAVWMPSICEVLQTVKPRSRIIERAIDAFVAAKSTRRPDWDTISASADVAAEATASVADAAADRGLLFAIRGLAHR